MKIVFYKDWNQIGCKVIPNATEQEMRDWLAANQNLDTIKKVIIKDE